MRVLALADEESSYLWDHFQPEKVRDVDLIIGCGDLCKPYLEFLATLCKAPILYVHGNHDTRFDIDPPGGARCLDDDVCCQNGLRIAGLGGSFRYRPGSWQFTEAEMQKRVRRLRRRIDRLGGLDILVTHAPLHGCGDLPDLPHRGFDAFTELLDTYHPALMLHGHVHLNYGPGLPREHVYGQTRVVNAYERVLLEVPDRIPPAPVPAPGFAERWRRWRAEQRDALAYMEEMSRH